MYKYIIFKKYEFGIIYTSSKIKQIPIERIIIDTYI